MRGVVVLVLLLVGAVSAADRCSWDSCPPYSRETNIINVHLVPHTHDDMGWLKTADDYFTGYHAQEVNLGVQYIIDSMVEALKRNPARKMVYAEVGYIARWLDTRTPNEINDLVNLVKTGQLELAGGGWVQPDEGASHYIDLIDQYTLGLRRLARVFGDTCGHPKVGWQLDPFGHSREHTNLLSLLGYEALHFGREDINEHIVRYNNKRMEFIWYISNENPNRTMLTGSYVNLYVNPDKMCWDVYCADQPVIANPHFENYNADAIVKLVQDYVNSRLPHQAHNHVLFMMGGDFQYQNAEQNFRNMDNLIKVISSALPNYRIFYSTPACYYKAIRGANVAWTNKTTDFFPYSSGANSYWSGYYTSKPALKGLVRRSSNLLNTVRSLSAFALASDMSEHGTIEVLEQAQALAQHHDAITGTSKEHVTQDYNYRILLGWDAIESVWQKALLGLSRAVKHNSVNFPTQSFCRRLNESVCAFTQNTTTGFTVTVTNGHSAAVSQLVRVPVWTESLELQDENNAVIDSSWLVPTFQNGNQLPTNDVAPFELHFVADLPALGFRTFFVIAQSRLVSRTMSKVAEGRARSISNGLIRVNFDNQNLVASVTDLSTGRNFPLKQQFLTYQGHDNNGQASGAYIFRPQSNTAVPVNKTPSLNIVYLDARQVFSPWISQTVRLTPGKRFIEFEWTVGPLPEHDANGKQYGTELITRYEVPGIASGDSFFTDSNGRQLMERKRNFNMDYQFPKTEPVASNMYPVNSRAILKDSNSAFVVLTDRSQAGGSILNSTFDLLLHRRDFYDDGFGVGEALNEPGRDGRGLVVRGTHRVILAAPVSALGQLQREAALELFHHPLVAFAPLTSSISVYRNQFAVSFSGLTSSFPENVKLLTLKQIDANTVLMRLEHIFALNEHPTLSAPVTVDLRKLFSCFTVQTVQEYLLGANLKMSGSTSAVITLRPQDIKTFLVTVKAV